MSPQFNEQFLQGNQTESKTPVNPNEEERKKLLLQDDTEDELIYDKINEIKDEIKNSSEIQPENNAEAVNSAVTFNNDQESQDKPQPEKQIYLDRDDSRPSDVVNFDDRSDPEVKTPEGYNSLKISKNVQFQNQENKESDNEEDVEKEDDDLKKEIDYENAKNEIEMQLKMINHEIHNLEEKERSSAKIEDNNQEEYSHKESDGEEIEEELNTNKFKRNPTGPEKVYEAKENKQSHKRQMKKWNKRKQRENVNK